MTIVSSFKICYVGSSSSSLVRCAMILKSRINDRNDDSRLRFQSNTNDLLFQANLQQERELV